MRSISEGAGVRRMSGAEDNEISGGKWARRITIREEAKFNISGGKYARRITIKEEVKFNISGGNAPGGNTRTHPEHDG